MRNFFILFALLALLGAPAGARTRSAAESSAAMPACAVSDPVVWVNTKSNIYHTKGEKYFGTTKQGKYACTSDAVKMGARAAKASSLGKHTAANPEPSETPGTTKKHKKHHKDASPEPTAT